MIRKDDRTPDERKTHTILVVGTDSFLSGWGEASGGLSYAAWACTSEQLPRVERWVRSRSDMKRVRIASDPYRPRCKHLHVYVVDNEHPANRE